MTKPFKPSIAFLRKVEAKGVYNAMKWSNRKGASYFTRGGDALIKAHSQAGLIKPPYVADFARPSYATLTDAGRALLDAAP